MILGFPCFLTGMRDLPLSILDRTKIEEIVAEAGNKIFHMGTEMSCYYKIAGGEDPFDHGKWSLNEKTCSFDGPVLRMSFVESSFPRTAQFMVLLMEAKGTVPNSLVPVYRLDSLYQCVYKVCIRIVIFSPFIFHVPSRLRRVFASSPRGLSADTWVGSDVINGAS